MSIDPMERVRAQVVFKHIFWAALAAETKVVPVRNDPRVKTAATDGVKVYYNVDWFNTLSPSVQLFVYIHEIAHKFSLHSIRTNGRDHDMWNVACDYVINLQLKAAGFDVWKNALISDTFNGLIEEEVYEKLKKMGNEKAKEMLANSTGGDVLAPPTDPAEQAKMKQDVQLAVSRAAMMAQQAGQMSAYLQRFVDGILKPKQAWWEQLTHLAQRLVRNDENWAVRNTRLRDRYLPGLKSYEFGEMVLLGDTSGSIGERDMKMIAGIAMSAVEELQPSLFRCIWWDADFCGEQVFMQGERPKAVPKGGGGTDMALAIKYVEDHYRPEALILVTDGWTPWPKHEPEFPLFVLTTDKPSPIGQTIKVSI